MDLRAAITSFYDAAHGERTSQNALSVLAEQAGGFGAVLLSIDKPGNIYGTTPNLVEAGQKYVAEHWYRLDPRYQATPLMTSRGFASEVDFISDDAIRTSPFYQDFVVKTGTFWWAGLGLKVNGETLCLAMQRTRQQGRFTATELNDLLAITPHLSGAIGLSGIVEQARLAGILEVTDCMKSAAFALDYRGAVLSHNVRAAKLIGKGLNMRSGRLEAVGVASDRRLQQLISFALYSADYADTVSRPVKLELDGNEELLVQALALESRHRYLFRKVAVLLIINQPMTEPPIDTLFRSTLNLTPKESRLSALLLEGRSVKECAEVLSIKENTARQHLKQVLQKSGTHRQGQLIALLSKLVKEGVRAL